MSTPNTPSNTHPDIKFRQIWEYGGKQYDTAEQATRARATNILAGWIDAHTSNDGVDIGGLIDALAADKEATIKLIRDL